MIAKELYKTSVKAVGGRNGRLESDDGLLAVNVLHPKELGGPGGATNPEQLFAGGYAACFESALNLVCRERKIKPDSTSVTAQVTLGKDAEDNFELAVVLDITLAGVQRAQAQELAEAAHQVCPYSRATRGNINVQLNVI
ncbi:organic hydroperoxide resistance protein [Paenibacillus glycanilyticus]|uniref:Organic hydroperoxide resistance protein n=1 Tax=Paenibacillus glycanilyticus TaxID=126569 RepID=A0ABQ6NTV8_9BACL|nr:organic hydroperoxide resistance protein [Paenibacillus glycanilyticus]GMK47414.1 organic hydroperoxide resistance protein [Paenibacillus glycanilyticus]